MKRLSPQPVVSVWPLVVEKTSTRRAGHPGILTDRPDITPRHDSHTSAALRRHPHAERDPFRSSLLSSDSPTGTNTQDGRKPVPSTQLARGGGDWHRAETSRRQSLSPAIGPVICHRRGPAARMPRGTAHDGRITDFSPYFSSSLTLSTRGAVSPARHVLTRPRPHPFSGQRGEKTPALGFRRSIAWAGEHERCRVFTQCPEARLSPVAAGLRRWSAGGDHVSHSPAPWQSRGRAGMLC